MIRAFPIARLTCCLLGAAIGLHAAAAWSQQSPSPAEAESRTAHARRMVAQLGADEYAAREAAKRELAEMGIFALEALQAGAKSGDREVRYNSLRLLATVHHADLLRRLAAFAEGRDDELDRPLPLWDEYRKLAGESAEARELFVEMQTLESGLLAAIEDDPHRAAALLGQRVQQIPLALRRANGQIEELGLGTVAALLLAAGDERVSVPARAALPIYTYCYQRSVQAALDGGPHEHEVRKLLGRWIARGEDSLAHQGLMLSLQHGIEEGLVPARRIIASGGSTPYNVQEAVIVVARLGDERHIPLLEPLLRDATHLTHRNVGEANRPVDVQMRDVALAALVHLSGQEFTDFGLKHIQPNPLTVFTANSACFETDAERAAAIEKWRDHRDRTLPKGR